MSENQALSTLLAELIYAQKKLVIKLVVELIQHAIVKLSNLVIQLGLLTHLGLVISNLTSYFRTKSIHYLAKFTRTEANASSKIVCT